MARTAPAPNLLAIPGMNPGIFVLAGDGDSGGSGAGGGKGGAGKQGANGKNGGKDANGGGKGAGACGKGGGGGCPGGHDGGGVTKGDPVDVASGRVLTVPAVDAQFVGPLGLEFVRMYSSAASERDVGLGFGWSHSFSWSVEVRRRTVEVWQDGGQRVVFPRPEVGQEVTGPLGWTLRAESWGFAVEADDNVRRLFAESNVGASHPSAGPRVEDRILLSSVEDKNGLVASVRYEGGRLTEIVDGAGRVLRIKTDSAGHIERIDAKNAELQGRTVVFARYLYNDAGQLIQVTDAAGADTRFEYDEDNRLTEFTSPNGLTFHFVLDEEGRCIETWGDRKDGMDPSLAPIDNSVAGSETPQTALSGPRISPFLADGRTKAKGILHNVIDHQVEGYCEVVDATRVQRFFFDEAGRITKASSGPSTFSRSYDALGLLTEAIDPDGNTETWKRDARGRVVWHKDAIGRVTEYERDSEGNVTKITDPDGGTTTVVYDARGNRRSVTDSAGHTTHYEVNDRGLTTGITWPDGSVVRIVRDRHGNISEVTAQNGAVFRMTYEHFGRQTSITGPTGATTTTSYDDRGDVVRVVSATGAASSFTYDAERNPIEYALPGGRTYRIGWAGLHQSVSLRRPDQSELRLFFDFDQKLMCIRNEIGELHHFSYDVSGFLSNEVTYDGRKLSYKFDQTGNLVAYDNGAGEWTELERDAAGQLVARKWPDGTEDTFEYNGVGQIVRTKNERVEVVYDRDAYGYVRRETQTVDGETQTIDVAVDSLGRRVERTTSFGLTEKFERDALGSVIKWSAGGDEAAFTNDLMGREVIRTLRLGGKIETALDAEGRLVRRRAVGTAGSGQVVGAGQPSWIGGQKQDLRMDRAYEWSPAGDLQQIWDQTEGLTQLSHDVGGRVLGVVHAKLQQELYKYDAAERVYETGDKAPRRTYGPGGRLSQRGNTLYSWDDAGRLVKKEVVGPAGTEPQVWLYTWDGADRLSSVLGPDGKLMEFVYDVFSRRVLKTERKRGISGAIGDKLVATTRFVWDRHTLAHEIRTAAAEAGDPIVEERTYSFGDDSFVPFAHNEARVVGGQREDLGTVHYATDPIGTPTHLIGPDGSVVGKMVRTAWGVTVEEGGRTTPLRFQGQYEDSETGLYYNRYRYYDPETGTYLSADPIGLAGGHLSFGYVRNPFVATDPFGLADANTAVTFLDNKGKEQTVTGTSGSGNMHPALEGFLPAYPDAVKGQKPPPKGSKGKCAEVDALSQVLDAKKVPKDATPEQVKEALKDVKKIETTEKTDSPGKGGAKAGAPKAACGYCKKMMSNLGIPPEKIVNG